MGSTTKGPYDPTSTAPVDTLLGNSTSGCILIHNLSQYELVVSTPDNLMQSFVAAWGWRRFDVSDPMPFIQWSVAATPAQSNPPLSAVFVESYELRETAPPQYFGVYQRQTSIGNNVSTTSSTGIQNDGNGPGTRIVESTPSDQGTSAENWNNDASGIEQILSAGVQRIVRKNVRGDNSALKAAIQFGDSGDTSITTVFGQLGISAADQEKFALGTFGAGSSIVGFPTSNSRGTGLGYRDAGGAAHNGLGIDPSTGNAVIINALQSLGGQASAGSFGAPVIVAQTINQHITATGTINVLSFTPASDGLYRINGAIRIGNGSATVQPGIVVQYTEPNSSSAATSSFAYASVTSGTPPYLVATSGAATLASPGTYPLTPAVIHVKAGNAITCQYNDPTGTPNDFVSFVIERLA